MAKQNNPAETANNTPPATPDLNAQQGGETSTASSAPDPNAGQTPSETQSTPDPNAGEATAKTIGPGATRVGFDVVDDLGTPLIDAEFDVVNVQVDAADNDKRYLTLRAVNQPNASNQLANGEWGGNSPRGLVEIVVKKEVADKLPSGSRVRVTLEPVQTEGVVM